MMSIEADKPDSTSPQNVLKSSLGRDHRHHMTAPTDDRSPKLPRGWLRAAVMSAIALAFVGVAVGFIAFLSQLRGAEIAPDRKADGIVVLTGGSSRVSDAMELLAAGYGRRLLISGGPPTPAAGGHPPAPPG